VVRTSSRAEKISALSIPALLLRHTSESAMRATDQEDGMLSTTINRQHARREQKPEQNLEQPMQNTYVAATVSYVAPLRHLCLGLWLIQALLLALFLFAGGLQLILPIAAMAHPSSDKLLRFLAMAQSLTAMGLTLPGLVKSSVGSMPLFASGALVLTLISESMMFRTGVAASHVTR
jgi:hypothetical protein